MSGSKIYIGDNLPILEQMPDNYIDLIYIDPPFNTGKKQKRTQIRTRQSEDGDRVGFNGHLYKTTVIGTMEYVDAFDDYIHGFLEPRLKAAHRVLAQHGTLYFHIDYREVYQCKLLLDTLFSVFDENKGQFLGEIIWAYDYGGRSRNRWPTKHDNILVYAKSKTPYFNSDFVKNEIDYRAPGASGTVVTVSPTDTWWHTIVPTNSKERTGYPTQKPLGILDRIILASSQEGDFVLDFFAGSGTTGESCLRTNRQFILIDDNPEAERVMRDRFRDYDEIEWIPDESS